MDVRDVPEVARDAGTLVRQMIAVWESGPEGPDPRGGGVSPRRLP